MKSGRDLRSRLVQPEIPHAPMLEVLVEAARAVAERKRRDLIHPSAMPAAAAVPAVGVHALDRPSRGVRFGVHEC